MARPRGDHAKRRSQVVAAAWRVIVRDGLDQTTIRAVARELGMATKAVTRYFKSKDELLVVALDGIVERQIRASVRAAGDQADLAAVERMLACSLPVTDEIRSGWRIWVAFLGRAVGNSRLELEHRRRYRTLKAMLVAALRRLPSLGPLATGRAIGAEADRLLALIDGIGVREAVNPRSLSPALQRRLIYDAVQALRSEGPVGGAAG